MFRSALHALGRGFWVAIVVATSGCGAKEGKRLSGLLITLDTTRADALSCYGNALGTTPHLDRLAAEGILFESAHTSVPLTLPAHTSMMTGLYPMRHGLRDNGIARLSPEAGTLAEAARDAGYDTGAFVGSVVLDPELGLSQGFAHYAHPQRTGEGAHGAEKRAAEVVDEALEWLAARDRSRPFFAWVHVYDPHHPYAPPADFDAAAWEDPYLAEVAYTDREIGRLLEALRADGTLEHTVVLLTSDHGEAFGEHGESTHGVLCFEETMHVPLLVRRPSDARAGERSRANASVVDVLPTMTGALGLDAPRGIDGIDLLAAVPASRGTYVESFYGYRYYGWSPLAGWVQEGGKYLHSATPLYFDLATDREEKIDLLGSRTSEVERARAALARLLEAPALAPLEAAGDLSGLLEELRALGYTGGADADTAFPSVLEPSDRIAPHLGVAYLERDQKAKRLERGGHLEEALAIHAAEAAANPHNSSAWIEAGRLQLLLGRTEQAVATIQRATRLPNPKERDFFALGTALVAAGRAEEALEPLQEAVRLSRGRPQYVQKWIDTLRSLGHEAEALRVRERFPSPRPAAEVR